MNPQKPILFYDGDCMMCSNFIQRILKWDKEKNALYLATLQGQFAKENLPSRLCEDLNTMVYLDKNEIYLRSSGVIRCIAQTGSWRAMLRVLLIIPSPIRDGIYNWVAKNRINWFGKSDQCRIATPEEKAKILA